MTNMPRKLPYRVRWLPDDDTSETGEWQVFATATGDTVASYGCSDDDESRDNATDAAHAHAREMNWLAEDSKA